MRINRLEFPAETMRELGPLQGEAQALFTLDAVEAELRWLRKALKLPANPDANADMDNDEWSALIESITNDLGPSPEIDGVGWFLSSSDCDRRALAYQIRRALRAVKHARTCVDADGTATGVLLPATFARRVEVLLGQAVLPLAWVRRLDLLRF